MDNPVVHFEILGSDGPQLIDFYRGLFGWPLQNTPLPGWPSYAIMEPPAEGIGGAVGNADAAPNGGVVVYVEVDDIDRAVAFYQDVFNLEKLNGGEGDAFGFGADFSVFFGMGVGALAYLVLAWPSVRLEAGQQDQLLREEGSAAI